MMSYLARLAVGVWVAPRRRPVSATMSANWLFSLGSHSSVQYSYMSVFVLVVTRESAGLQSE